MAFGLGAVRGSPPVEVLLELGVGWCSRLAGGVGEGVWLKTGMGEVAEPRSPETAVESTATRID